MFHLTTGIPVSEASSGNCHCARITQRTHTCVAQPTAPLSCVAQLLLPGRQPVQQVAIQNTGG